MDKMRMNGGGMREEGERSDGCRGMCDFGSGSPNLPRALIGRDGVQIGTRRPSAVNTGAAPAWIVTTQIGTTQIVTTQNRLYRPSY